MPDLAAILADLRVPVVVAPMAGAAGGRLAAAVSAGGGLGMVGVGNVATVDQVRRVRHCRRVGAALRHRLDVLVAAAEPGALDVALESGPTVVSLSLVIHDLISTRRTTRGRRRRPGGDAHRSCRRARRRRRRSRRARV